MVQRDSMKADTLFGNFFAKSLIITLKNEDKSAFHCKEEYIFLDVRCELDHQGCVRACYRIHLALQSLINHHSEVDMSVKRG